MFCIKCGLKQKQGAGFCTGCGTQLQGGQQQPQQQVAVQQNTMGPMRNRNLGMMVLLTIVTFGIYNLYWYCSVQNQIHLRTGKGFSGVGHFFMSIVTLGIYVIYWYFVVSGRIKLLGGKNRGATYGLIYLVTFILGSILMYWDCDMFDGGTCGLVCYIGYAVLGVGGILVMLLVQRDINKISATNT